MKSNNGYLATEKYIAFLNSIIIIPCLKPYVCYLQWLEHFIWYAYELVMEALNPTCLVTYHYVFYTAMVNCFYPYEKRLCRIFLTEQDNNRNRIKVQFQKINISYGTPFLYDNLATYCLSHHFDNSQIWFPCYNHNCFKKSEKRIGYQGMKIDRWTFGIVSTKLLI